MSSASASVEFKAIGQQQVVSAFKSVGDSAAMSATKVQQNSNAMKTVGQGMKSQVSSIGQVATAFATLSLSIVNTWRSYRDLHSQQLDIDKMNTKISKAELSLKLDREKLTAATKAASKGGLAYHGTQLDIAAAHIAVGKAEHDHGKKSIEYAQAQQKLNELQAAGNKGTQAMTDLESKIALKEEGLANMKGTLAQKQKSYNDTIQDFYLSIAPLAISTIATLTTAFSGLKGTLTGGIGLTGLGGIGLILGGITLAIIAFKTNFLGLRDAVGGVIKWFQERFGAWKKTIEEVFGFIKKGDWNGAFNRIKEAAMAFWADLKKTVPFFGEVGKLIEKIQNGNWKGAFLQIWKAASDAWATIKKNIPIFGKIEDFLTGIAKGDWKGTFTKIAQGIQTAFNETLGKGIEWMFGKNWKAGLDAKIAEIKAEASVKGIPVPIEIALEINAAITKVTGVDIIKWFTDHPIPTALPIALTGGLTLSITDPTFQAGLKKGSEIILNALGAAFKTASNILDPYMAGVVKALNWNTVITSARETILTAGQAIWDTIFQGIQGGFQGQDWLKLFSDFGKTVDNAWKINAPDLQKQLIQNWNDSPAAKGLAGLGVKFNATPVPDPKTPQIIQNAINPDRKNPYKVPIASDTSQMPPVLKKQLTGVMNGQHPKVKIDADLTAANAKWQAFAHKVQMTKLQVQIAGTSVNIRRGSQAGAYGGPKQHGYEGTVKRPTFFLAGEGGRQEDISIKPRGSAGGGNGGFSGTINVYVDGVVQKAKYDIQGNYK